MSEPKSSESDSDLSSNSSWTLLDEHLETKSDGHIKKSKILEEKSATDGSATPVVLEQVENKCSNSSISGSSINEASSTKPGVNSFLTFDEYLQERLVEYDYGDESEPVETERREEEETQRHRKKCKAETIQILSMTCSLLVLTGLSLLCILFPQKVHENVIHNIEDTIPAVANCDNCDLSQTIDSLNRTQDLMNLVSESQLIDAIKDDLQSTSEPHGPKLWEKTDLVEDIVSEEDSDIISNIIEEEDEYFECNTKVNEEDQTRANNESADNETEYKLPIIEPPRRSRLSGLKEFLSKTNILTILSCVLHNICVLKTMKHFYSREEPRKEQASTQQPTNQDQSNQQIEHSQNKVDKPQDAKTQPKTGSKRKVKVSKISKRLTVKETPFKQYRAYQNSLTEQFMKPVPHESFSFNFSAIDPVNIEKSSVSLPADREFVDNILHNKRKEYQQKSGELDRYKRKTEMFTEQHRKRIKVLKSEFHQEVADAKKRELESAARSRRISVIKENFILRLKQHREKYLNDLKKLKEERQVLLKQLCCNKQSLNVESKDVAVGNYVVPMTGLCAFEEKLKLLKEKEASNIPIMKKSVPLFSGLKSEPSENKLCSYQSSPCFKIDKLKLEKYVPFHRTYTRDAQKKKVITDGVQDQTYKLAEMRKHYLAKQTEILDEYSRLMTDEVSKIERASGKLVEPCISLLDEIILEAVDMVRKKKETPEACEPIRRFGIFISGKKKPKQYSRPEGTPTTNTSCNRELSIATAESTEATKNLLRRLDMYTALFEKQAKTIKMMESQKLRQERPDITPVHTRYLSKQDPQRCYVEKITRGHY